MSNLTIAAGDVRPGDRIHNSDAYHASAAWLEVLSVDTDAKGYVSLHTSVYTDVRHGRQGIAVRRAEPAKEAL